MWAAITRELRDRRVSLIAYSLVAFLTLLLYMALYPSIHASMANFEQLYKSYPQEFYKALGIENFSISTAEGYLAVEYFSIVWVMLAVFFATSRAGAHIAGEIEKGVMSFYLMLPISRSKLYASKYAAFLVALVLFTALSVTVIIPLAAIYGNSIDSAKIWHITGISFLFTWAVYATALLLSAIFSERSKVYMIIGGLVVAMYVGYVIAGLQKDWEWLRNFTIFYYYNAQEILQSNNFKLSSWIVFGACIVVCSAVGWLAFRRRDIAA